MCVRTVSGKIATLATVKARTVLLLATVAIVGLAGCTHTSTPPIAKAELVAPATKPADDIGTAVYVDGELLKDYEPKSALKTKVTLIDKPKFPVIDVHCHWSLQQKPEQLLRAMDKLGEEKAVNLSGGWGEDLDKMLAKFHAVAPDRLLIFCNIDYKHVDDPTFETDVAAYLKAARAKGVSGLKVFKNLGLTAKDKSGKVIPVDDPRLDPAWETCADLHMPVLIHSADPSAFFQPVDKNNERWMQLKRHPDWSFYDKKFPGYDEVLGQLIHVVEKHPRTAFIAAHLANSGEDLQKLSAWLDKYPNLYADLSGRVPELGRQPYAARKFLLKYQDRICFGTDRFPGRIDQPREKIYYRFLETEDEYFNYYDHPFPTEGDWRIYGVHLPDEVLEKIYNGNAERALKGEMPAR